MLNVVMLSATMLSVIMLNVIMRSVVMLNVIMLYVVMLSVIMLNGVKRNVVMLHDAMLSVMHPFHCMHCRKVGWHAVFSKMHELFWLRPKVVRLNIFETDTCGQCYKAF